MQDRGALRESGDATSYSAEESGVGQRAARCASGRDQVRFHVYPAANPLRFQACCGNNPGRELTVHPRRNYAVVELSQQLLVRTLLDIRGHNGPCMRFKQ